MLRVVAVGVSWVLWVVFGVVSISAIAVAAEPVATCRIEAINGGSKEMQTRFNAAQLALLEKLNRRDIEHLLRLKEIVMPEAWDLDELAFSPLPRDYPAATAYPKLVVVDQPMQVFGAYENGRLVRWGPVSTGRQSRPTPPGLFHLNWRSSGHHSTVDPQWYMRWYFNFDNRQGLSLHEYELPGYAASHACVRLLARDARWLFDWGEEWQLSEDRREVSKPGTPLFIVAAYGFDAPPPWTVAEPLGASITLPSTIPAE
jgi:lipoprotein-anchoring transpeptidase ErfK/SrfK